MISSITGNHGESTPGVGLPDKTMNKDNGNTFVERFSRVSPGGVERFDVADFSSAAGLLSEPLLLPSERNVKELSADLSAKLTDVFYRSGISPQPYVEFKVDVDTGLIMVKGDCHDAQEIERAINSDPEMKRLFQTINAISTHAYEIPKHLKFQREYLASHDPEQVVAKYASLFGRQSGHDFSLAFDGNCIRMLVDGRVWTMSAAES